MCENEQREQQEKHHQKTRTEKVIRQCCTVCRRQPEQRQIHKQTNISHRMRPCEQDRARAKSTREEERERERLKGCVRERAREKDREKADYR